MLFGTIVLDPQNDAWLMKRDLDIRQHYVGWMAFRNSVWTYPVGMINSLSYPIDMSIVFTDSIPLAAIIFKLLRGILPETFQYFGLFTLISFSLQGGYAAKILRRITDRAVIWAAMPVVFILSFSMIHRSFYHTSLTAQWIILLCIDLWLGGAAYKRSAEKAVIWGLVSLLCVGIHTYFLPMALCILCTSELERILSGGYKNEKVAGAVTNIAGAGVSFMLCALVFLYALGAFASPSSEEYWVGDFTSNLNCFFNSNGRTLFLPALPLCGELQTEGIAYLGMGIIIMCAAALIFEVTLKVVGGKTADGISLESGRNSSLLEQIRRHPRRVSFAIAAIIFVLVSVLPTVTLGDRILFTAPYSRALLKTAGIFRSNGRFMWPVMYFIFIWASYEIDRFGEVLKKRDPDGVKLGRILVIAIVSVCVITQLVDYYPWLRRKFRKARREYQDYMTDWDELEVPEEYEHFVTFQNDTTYRIAIAYYAQKHGMTTNSFYFARGIEGLVEETNKEQLNSIMNHAADEKTVYVFDLETYETVRESGLHFYKCEKSVCGTVNPIEGKSELTDDQLAEIEFPK